MRGKSKRERERKKKETENFLTRRWPGLTPHYHRMHFCKTQILLVLPLPRSHPCLPTSSGLWKHEDIFICSSMDAQSWGRAGRAGRRQPGSRAQVEQRAPLGQVGSRGWQAAAAMGAEAPSLRSYFRFSFSKLPGSKRKLQGWGNNEKGSLFPPSPNSYLIKPWKRTLQSACSHFIAYLWESI